MAAWEIKKLWTANEIAEYRAYVAAQVESRVGNQRCTCEDLSLRVVMDFAEARGLPVAFANGAYPRRYFAPNRAGAGAGAGSRATTTLARRHGLTPEDFDSAWDFQTTVMASTGASDLLNHGVVRFVPGAVEGKVESLDLARVGDLIILRPGGHHVQVVTAVGDGLVRIMQGNFRPKGERANAWDKLWGDQNDPNDPLYIGAIVGARDYARDAKRTWTYDGKPLDFKAEHGRLTVWDFDAWNALIVERVVGPHETLSAIAMKQWGNGNAWKRIYGTNRTTIGSNPDHVRPGTKLYLWR